MKKTNKNNLFYNHELHGRGVQGVLEAILHHLSEDRKLAHEQVETMAYQTEKNRQQIENRLRRYREEYNEDWLRANLKKN